MHAQTQYSYVSNDGCSTMIKMRAGSKQMEGMRRTHPYLLSLSLSSFCITVFCTNTQCTVPVYILLKYPVQRK